MVLYLSSFTPILVILHLLIRELSKVESGLTAFLSKNATITIKEDIASTQRWT